MFSFPPGDGDNTEQHEPLLSESQDESLTLLGRQDSITATDVDEKTDNVNDDDLDESVTPLLGGDEDDGHRNEVRASQVWGVTRLRNQDESSPLVTPHVG